MNFVALSRTND